MNTKDVTVIARRIQDFQGSLTLRTADLTEVALPASDSFMQSAFWAVFKSRTGWLSFECEVTSAGEHSILYVLVRSLKAHVCFCYVPHGPASVPSGFSPKEYLEALGRAISDAIKGQVRSRIIFVRFDLAWECDTPMAVDLSQALNVPERNKASNSPVHNSDNTHNSNKKKTNLTPGTPVQVPDTVVLPLEDEPEQLLASMKPKWRYNIRLAQKKGVEVVREGAEALGAFQKLYEETAKRDEIAIHEASYYKALFLVAAEFRSQEKLPLDLSVWTAKYEGKPLAAIITLFFNKHATYLYGASSNQNRNLMPAYALQWNAILAAKEAGCVDYDFFGIPPTDDPNHPMAGLYFFKTGFGGRVVHRIGAIDYPVAPVVYKCFRSAEGLRLYWYKSVKKLFRKHQKQAH
ncbi:MAG TPA: peptidoglycan bridge formation glycyltransferase FemA/FemB family protein [Spirochaetales bacterium]|nr:peptidoglycan bridge formation glycyltransferase FemA/FemB family protein [Spirochaetales bacterium]